MLTRGNYQRGFTLIEIMIALVIVSILLFAAAPAFTAWIQNTRIRTTGDSILTGLQLARAEAVRRNTPMSLSLTDSADNTCALSTAGTSWVISQANPAGACGTAPSDTAAPPDPRIFQTRTASEGSGNTTVAAQDSVFTYNGMGRLTAAPTAPGNIDIRNPAGGACAPGGPMRCLRIVVSLGGLGNLGGLARMCDPARPNTDPQGC